VTSTYAPLLFSLCEESRTFFRGYKFSETLIERGAYRNFKVWKRVDCYRSKFCLALAYVTLQAGRTLNVHHTLCCIDQLTDPF